MSDCREICSIRSEQHPTPSVLSSPWPTYRRFYQQGGSPSFFLLKVRAFEFFGCSLFGSNQYGSLIFSLLVQDQVTSCLWLGRGHRIGAGSARLTALVKSAPLATLSWLSATFRHGWFYLSDDSALSISAYPYNAPLPPSLLAYTSSPQEASRCVTSLAKSRSCWNRWDKTSFPKRFTNCIWKLLPKVPTHRKSTCTPTSTWQGYCYGYSSDCLLTRLGFLLSFYP